MTYLEYLNSEDWEQKRTLKLEQSPKCEGCLESDNLQVHHLNYGKWHDVRMSDLMTLCRSCHHILHALIVSGEIKEYMETTCSLDRSKIARTELKKLLRGTTSAIPQTIARTVDPVLNMHARRKRDKRRRRKAEKITNYLIINGCTGQIIEKFKGTQKAASRKVKGFKLLGLPGCYLQPEPKNP